MSLDWITYNPETGEFRKLIYDGMHSNIRSRVEKKPQCFTVNSNGYKVTNFQGKLYYLHRLAILLGTGRDIPDGMFVDHINGDRLDNRLRNLRVVTKQQSAMNVAGTRKTSRFKGVNRYKDRWQASIIADGKRYRLGFFPSEELAALAYNEAATNLHGEFARLNKI